MVLSWIDILMTIGFLYILWNSWESMFVGNQNFPVLWGRNFVGSQFVIIFINIKRLWWCKVVGKGYLWKPRTLTSTNNDDSTVIHFTHESKLFLVTIFDISFFINLIYYICISLFFFEKLQAFTVFQSLHNMPLFFLRQNVISRAFPKGCAWPWTRITQRHWMERTTW